MKQEMPQTMSCGLLLRAFFLRSISSASKSISIVLTLEDSILNKYSSQHGLRQKAATNDNRETYLEQVLHAAVDKYRIIEPIPYESLTAEMMLDID